MKKNTAFPGYRARKQKGRTGKPLEAPVAAADVLYNVLTALGAGPERARLFALWQNWDFVMGDELAPLAHPLGQHKGTLLIGVEDTMLMQELHFLSNEILERANAFMAEQFFTSVRLSLVLNRTLLNQPVRLTDSFSERMPRANPLPARPNGCFLAEMDPASPVAQCYAHFTKKKDGK